ncbi:molybdate ABC transporter permease subunit [Longirhabdus pacifica]|uniref:molybdate ABC transporter permease subunit n=1 Tax=Longirhabdus pacifica TaxID=2305227 RepID=UPI00100878DD|nr:molybdate ABC transporter permease subunit [Longirhabdus pacifica]
MNFSPLWLSLKVAGTATFIVLIIGLPLARWMARRQFYGKTVVESIIMLPMVLPPTVVGFALLYLFGKNGWIGSWLWETFGFQIVFTWIGAVLAAIVVSFPLMYQSTVAAFQKYDVNVEHAAYTMGASRWKVFWTLSMPLAWPGLLAGLILSFARSLGEFGATLMIAGYIPNKTDTIPLTIYFAVEAGDKETATIWVLIILTLGFSAVFWLNWWSKRNVFAFTTGKKDT